MALHPGSLAWAQHIVSTNTVRNVAAKMGSDYVCRMNTGAYFSCVVPGVVLASSGAGIDATETVFRGRCIELLSGPGQRLRDCRPSAPRAQQRVGSSLLGIDRWIDLPVGSWPAALWMTWNHLSELATFIGAGVCGLQLPDLGKSSCGLLSVNCCRVPRSVGRLSMLSVAIFQAFVKTTYACAARIPQ